jgi:hypothetical protein
LGFKGFQLDLIPHKVYFFELSIKFDIKSTPKTLKLVNISRESEKGAKNSYGSYPTEFVPEVQKLGTKSVTNPKAKVSKLNGKGRSGEPNFSGQTADGTRQTAGDGIFFFVQIGFSSIKSPNSSRKSIKNLFLEITKSVLYINFVHRK